MYAEAQKEFFQESGDACEYTKATITQNLALVVNRRLLLFTYPGTEFYIPEHGPSIYCCACGKMCDANPFTRT